MIKKNKRFQYNPIHNQNNRSYFRKKSKNHNYNFRLIIILIILFLLTYLILGY